jgi:hypothetical protein
MGSMPPLLSFLLMIVSGWVHRHQLIVFEFLQAENRLLKDRLRGKRIRFTDAERAAGEKSQSSGTQGPAGTGDDRFSGYAAALASTIDRREMEARASARAWAARNHAEDLRSDCAQGPGQSGLGYTRIQGALGNLGHRLGRGTIANVLKRSGIGPSPERSKRTTWSTFLKAHWKVLAGK